MMTIERTAQELRRRIIAAQFQEISVTMACNGDEVTIKRCGGVVEPKSFDQVEYYLVFAPSLPWLGGDTLEKIAEQLNGYKKMLEEAEDDKKKLLGIKKRLEQGGIDRDEWDDLYSYYSDYHKDVYGYRPRDVVCPF